MISDLRFAWRALWKSPTTTLGAMLALALGIGATTTMFGLLNAVALRPLPYPESDRLVELWGNVERAGRRAARHVDSRLPGLEGEEPIVRSRSSAWTDNGFIMYGNGAPERVDGRDRCRRIFAVLGVEPMLGRG